MASIAHPELADLLTQKTVQRNLSTPKLVEAAIRNGEGVLSARGALVSETGKRTGRSPKDKFTVRDAVTENKVDWGSVNLPFSPERFDALYERVLEYLGGKQVYVQDLFCGADPRYQLPRRPEARWHQLRSFRHRELHPPPGHHRRHAVCRRDEEVHLRRHE